jgi:heptaprenyl diphosphate synthase
MGILCALTVVLSIFESILSPAVGLPPGIKLGLANVVIMFTSSLLGFLPALLLSVVKAVFSGITRGGTAFIMSGCAGIASTIVVSVLINANHAKTRKPLMGSVGISAIGGIIHNMVQLIVCGLLVGSFAIIPFYLPLLLISGLLAGGLTGMLFHTAQKIRLS